MKKTILLFAAIMMAAVTFAQNQPTVSASSVTFKYCKTTEGSERKTIASTDFPFTWHDVVCPTPGTYVTTLVNARGCDSIVTLIAEEFHPFSVAANKKVQLAKGNLRYRDSDKKYHIADNCWDVIGNTNANRNPQVNQSDWMDLFSYGTGDNPIRCGANDQNTNHYSWTDWGVNIIDDYPAGYWYTMTKSEWEYLCTKRSNYNYLIKYNVKVNSKNGWIILPDDWDRTGFSFQSSYTADEWVDMEAKGAIFLPEAGYRSGNSYQSNTNYYWVYDSSAYFMWLANSYLVSSGDKFDGYAVRLAHYPGN